MRVLARIVLLLFGVFLAEAALQLVTLLAPPVEARLSGLKPRYVADPVLYVRGDSSLPEYDEHGFRDERRPAQADIVAIGDSQTEGSGVARANAWPQQLAARLETSVYQLAFGGYGPGQYLALVDEALALQPRTIIIAVYTGNDLAGAYDWVYAKGRNPELRTGAPGREADFVRAERERGPIDRAWQVTQDAEKGLYGRPVLAWLRENVESRSKLVTLYDQLRWHLSGRAATLDIDAGAGDWADTLRGIDGVPPEILFPFDDGLVRTVFTPNARLSAQDVSDPRIDEGLILTCAVLQRIAERCKGRARLMVLLIPTKELVFAKRVLRNEKNPPAAFTRLVEQEKNVRARLTRELQARSIETIDPLPKMRSLLATMSLPRPVSNPYAESWDGHPTATGYSAISRAVAAAISHQPA
jgi:lysophospholipase L1-like esterase